MSFVWLVVSLTVNGVKIFVPTKSMLAKNQLGKFAPKNLNDQCHSWHLGAPSSRTLSALKSIKKALKI